MEKISFKNINKLAIPAIIAGISEPIISLVDTAIIGKLGTVELGGVGVASSFFLLIVWTLAQTKSVISAIVSRSYGENSLQKLNEFVPQSILLNVLIGFLFLLLTVPFSNEIFTLYNASGNLLHFATSYFNIRAIGFPLTLATFAIFGVFRGLQNTKWAMQISLIGGSINVFFDFILVYGVPGIIKSYGVEGAAYATLIAQISMLLLSLHFLLKRTPFSFQKTFSKSHPLLKTFLKMSSNLFIRTIALNMAYYLGIRYATLYGAASVAAHTILMNIWLFSSFFIDGYANAGNAMSGKLIGEQDHKALYKLTFKLLKINILIATGLSFLYLISYPFMGSFFSNDSTVIELFKKTYWLVLLSQPINAIAFTLDGIFKGLGKTILLRNTLLLSTFLVFLPVILGTDAYQPHLIGIWVSFLIWMIARGGILIHFFIKNYKSE